MQLDVSSVLERFNRFRKKRAISVIGGMLLIGGMTLLSIFLAKPNTTDKFIDESSYPVEASDFILQNIDLETMRLYNEYNYGSYLLYREIPVFVDSRADLYAPEFNGEEDIFMDFIRTSNINTFYEDTFNKYDITHIILKRSSKTNLILSRVKDNRYEQLYIDNYFVIYKYN
jgi:hypothetical protein